MDALLAVTKMNGNMKLLTEMFGHVLSTIDGTVLTACTSEGYLQVSETSVYPALNMKINDGINVRKELKDFAIMFQKVNNRLVESCQELVLLVTSWIVAAATVKHVATTIT